MVYLQHLFIKMFNNVVIVDCSLKWPYIQFLKKNIENSLTSMKSKNSGLPNVPLGNVAGGSSLLWCG